MQASVVTFCAKLKLTNPTLKSAVQKIGNCFYHKHLHMKRIAIFQNEIAGMVPVKSTKLRI
jgi:hypothetical protein